MSSSAPVRNAYHHGDLRNALIGAAADLARSGGPGSVTVRAAARAVGVTPTAAYRHFTRHEELLSAAKEQALDRLSDSMSAELRRLPETGDPIRGALCRLAAIGRGYLSFAQAEPGLFRTAFAHGGALMPALEDHQDTSAFRKLVDVMDDLVEAGYLPVERRGMAEVTVWSAVHGLAMLYLDGPLRAVRDDERERTLERTVEIIAEGLGGAVLTDDLRAALFETVRERGQRSGS